MSAATPYVASPRPQITQPDPVPSHYKRAAGDLKHLVSLRQAEVDALSNRIPVLKRDGNTEGLEYVNDLLAVHKEVIFQLEAGIAAGQARAEKAQQNQKPR